MRGDRGQSEALSFVLVFSIMMMMVGVTYALGVASLTDLQQSERDANMERAFEVLDDNLRDIYLDGAPSRATEVKLAGGQIELDESTSIEVYVENGTANRTYPMSSRPITYVGDGDTEITYAAGAIIRSEGDAAVMLSEPDWIVGGDRVVVPFVVTTPSQAVNRTSLGGKRTALVVTKRRSPAGSYRFYDGSGNAKVRVTVESQRAVAWKRYLEANGFTAPTADAADPSDGKIRYWYNGTDAVLVQRNSISVELRS